MAEPPKDYEMKRTPEQVFVKMDQLLAQMQVSVDEMRQALMIIAQIPPETMTSNEKRAKRSELVAKVITGLMSGRWHLRDGDSYGIVRQPGVPRTGPFTLEETGQKNPNDQSGLRAVKDDG